jgi:hypothetical protein
MARLLLGALLAAQAASLQAQPPAPAVAVQSDVDSAAERKRLRDLSACLAEARPRWARKTLSYPYLSDAQASAAATALSGKDTCITRPEAEVTFRTSSLVGSLAEHFLQTDLRNADFARLTKTLSTLEPLNVTEDFALCVASRNPAAARDLSLSEPGSAAEAEAGRKLSAHIEGCTVPGEDLKVDMQSLRALVATALYRGVSVVLARS